MNALIPAGFPYAPVHYGPDLDGVQAVFRFSNGYGASVIRHRRSYGTELAVARFTGEGHNDWDFASDVLTDVGDGHGIIGWIASPDELATLLGRIEALPAPIEPAKVSEIEA